MHSDYGLLRSLAISAAHRGNGLELLGFYKYLILGVKHQAGQLAFFIAICWQTIVQGILYIGQALRVQNAGQGIGRKA